jgi:hypothetical protein
MSLINIFKKLINIIYINVVNKNIFYYIFISKIMIYQKKVYII